MVTSELYDKWGRDFHPGQTIFKEGDEGDLMYIIQEGSVEVVKRLGNAEWVVAILGKGDFFGEMALVSRIRRTATVRAITEVKLLAFDRAGFQQMIEKNSRMAMAIIDKLCRRLELTTSQLVELGQANVQTAIAAYLQSLKSARPEQSEWELKTVVAELSSILQLPQEKLIKSIMEFAQRCAVKINNDKIVIDTRDQFKEILEGGGSGTCVE